MRRIYYGLVIGFILLTIMWTCMHSFFNDMCGNQVISEGISPDGKYKYVVFVRDCGATTGFSTQVSIIETDKKLRDDLSGNVLTLDDHYFGEHLNKFGGADVKIDWISNREILIQFDSKAEGGKRENKVKGVKVIYEQIE